MIASEIMLPPHAPEIYLDRATLWNAVENCEKHPKAQLAYSFDIAMQNELTLEENMELARKFVQEQFVTKGMIADLAFHSPEKEDGGIPNPHFHVMTTMRPLNPDGTWGQKQRREYLLDEDGNRIRDKNGDYMSVSYTHLHNEQLEIPIIPITPDNQEEILKTFPVDWTYETLVEQDAMVILGTSVQKEVYHTCPSIGEKVTLRWFDGTEHSIDAVSYTHLDVYKRQ